MAHADMILYNAAQVILKDSTISAILGHLDPKAMEQLREGVRTFDEENAPAGTEYVVDLYIPFTAVVPAGMAENEAEAEVVARDAFVADGLYERCVEAMTDSVFGMSDSEWRVEVGEG